MHLHDDDYGIAVCFIAFDTILGGLLYKDLICQVQMKIHEILKM